VKILRREESAGRKRFRYVMAVSAVAEDVMSRPVISVDLATPVSTIVKLMKEHHIASVVVVKNGELRGIVKRDDIIREVAK
jgi:CBS domain-containing protein